MEMLLEYEFVIKDMALLYNLVGGKQVEDREGSMKKNWRIRILLI